MARAIAITAFVALLSVVSAQAPPALSVDPNLPKTAPAGPHGVVIPSLSAIVSGAPLQSEYALDSTYAPGSKPTDVGAAPAVPTPPVQSAGFPPLDVLPPLDSPEVKAWVAAIDWTKVPTYAPTTGECATSPGAMTDGRCWWTCGGCTRATDIETCPTKMTWGLSFDDGPSPYTPLLLSYLNENKLKSTFFCVGSRVVSRPDMVVAEYMTGHQISVHTWSHKALTTLKNEEIVAELGWTQKAIKDVIGVTPNTFRPPYGDIDDRVRAIAAQMGMTPIMWTGLNDPTTGARVAFDTTDWNIPGGQATGESSLSKFQKIINDYAPTLNTGFIVLEHDLYQQTVDLAVGYFLPMALATGKYAMKSIIECLGLPNSEAYIETSSNTTSTIITAGHGGSTFFQPKIGSQTGAPPSKTLGGAAASSAASGAAAASGKASGASRASTYGPIAVVLAVAGASLFA